MFSQWFVVSNTFFMFFSPNLYKHNKRVNFAMNVNFYLHFNHVRVNVRLGQVIYDYIVILLITVD